MLMNPFGREHIVWDENPFFLFISLCYNAVFKIKLYIVTSYGKIIRNYERGISMEKQKNDSNNNSQNFLTHSLVGNTTGKNNTQTLTNLLNQTTVKPSNQTTKGRE